MPAGPTVGWYPNPQRGPALRWWDGAGWTSWVSDGTGVWDERPQADTSQQVDGLRFVRETFLPEARRRGVVGGPELARLELLATDLDAEARHGAARTAPVQPGAATAAAAATAYRPAAQTGPTATPRPAVSRSTPDEPGPGARWWTTVRRRLDLDLTVHGLAYLGVLLLFVGVFGLVAFAFGDVAAQLRPVAELAVAVVPFLAARLLVRSGARVVARAMVAVGGLLLALMLVTSAVDGAPFPPDLHGAALPLGTGTALAVLAAGYVLLARRRPTTSLVTIVAPVLWLMTAMAGVGLGRPVPTGEDVAVPGAAQVAVVALAVLGTTALGRVWAGRGGLRGRLAEGALAAAQPGAVVVGVLAVVAGLVEGWPVLPFVVVAVALGAVPRLTGRVSAASANLVLVLAWLVVVVRWAATGVGAPLLSPDGAVVGPAALPVLVPAALVIGLLIGDRLIHDGPGLARALLVWALPVVGLLALPDGWWAVGATALLTAWATWRRADSEAVRGSGGGLDVAAATGPLLVLATAAAQLTAPATLVLAAVLVLAVTPLARGWLRRPGAVDLWRWWWTVVGGLTLLGTVLGAAGGGLSDAGEVFPLAVLVLLVALVAGPLSGTSTVWAATPVTWWAWLLAAGVLGVDLLVLTGVLALLGLAAVLLGARRRPVPDGSAGADAAGGQATGRRSGRHRTWGALGLAGHLTGVVAGLVATAGAPAGQLSGLFTTAVLTVPLAVAVVVGTGGWLVTALTADRADAAGGPAPSASPLVDLIDRLDPATRYLPWAAALTGSVMSLVLILQVTGVLPVDHPWSAVVLTATGLVLAAATRVLRAGRVLPLLPWFAYGLVLLGVLFSSARWPAAVALAGVGLHALLSRRRHAVPVWSAWLAITPLVAILVGELVPEVPADQRVAVTLVAVGGLLALGAHLAARTRPSEPRLLPGRSAAVPPAVLGAAELLLGVLLTLAVVGPRSDAGSSGAILLGAAVLVAGIAGVTGVGTTGALAVLLGWLAVDRLLGDPGAWVHVAAALVMAGAAQAVTTAQQERVRDTPDVRWARWDTSLAVGAILPALVAVVTARPAERIAVLLVVGAAVVAAAVSLRRRRILSEVLGWVGTVLVLAGTLDAGPWWTVLGLTTLSAAHTALAAVREPGTLRTVRQWTGAVAAAAAWCLVPAAAGWDAQRASEVTAVVGAAGLLAIVLTVRTLGRGRSWLTPWGGVGAVLAVGAAIGVSIDPQTVAGWWDTSSGVPGVISVMPVTGPLLTTWWHTSAWLLLTGSAALLVRLAPSAWWREVAGTAAMVSLLVGMGTTEMPASARVLVLVAVSCAAAVGTVLAARGGSAWSRAVAAVGVAAVLLGAVTLVAGAAWSLGTGSTGGTGGPGGTGAIPSGQGPVLAAAVLATAAVQSAALGVARRVLGLRLAAPALAWLAWAWYAAQSLGSAPVWFTVPVGLALLVVVAVWRADRRARDLPPADRSVVGLELAGIGFLVVSSFVAALTVSVLHALVAAAIGVVVTLWGVATRVRRRLLAGAGVVLVGITVAVVVPLAALLPTVGQAGMWVLVAVVGLGVVLAATFLERGRSTVRDGRTRLVDATQGWE